MEKLLQDPSVPNSALFFVWIRFSFRYGIVRVIYFYLAYVGENEKDNFSAPLTNMDILFSGLCFDPN